MISSNTDIAEGVTRAIINLTIEQVRSFVDRFKNHDIAFVGNKNTIDILKEQIKSGEWDISSKYVDDKEIKLLIRMGLTLRKLEFDGKIDQLHDLRERIRAKFSYRGLHISQVVQRGILTILLATISSKLNSIDEVKHVLKELFDNIEKTVLFVKETDNVDICADQVKTAIYANRPSTFIIFGKLSAVPITTKIIQIVRMSIDDYDISEYTSNKRDLIYFLTKKSE